MFLPKMFYSTIFPLSALHLSHQDLSAFGRWNTILAKTIGIKNFSVSAKWNIILPKHFPETKSFEIVLSSVDYKTALFGSDHLEMVTEFVLN